MGTEGDSGEGTGCKQYNRDRPELVKQGPAVSPGTGSHTNRPSGRCVGHGGFQNDELASFLRLVLCLWSDET